MNTNVVESRLGLVIGSLDQEEKTFNDTWFRVYHVKHEVSQI